PCRTRGARHRRGATFRSDGGGQTQARPASGLVPFLFALILFFVFFLVAKSAVFLILFHSKHLSRIFFFVLAEAHDLRRVDVFQTKRFLFQTDTFHRCLLEVLCVVDFHERVADDRDRPARQASNPRSAGIREE